MITRTGDVVQYLHSGNYHTKIDVPDAQYMLKVIEIAPGYFIDSNGCVHCTQTSCQLESLNELSENAKTIIYNRYVLKVISRNGSAKFSSFDDFWKRVHESLSALSETPEVVV